LIEVPPPKQKTGDFDLAEVTALFNAKAGAWDQKYQAGGDLVLRVAAFEELLAARLSPNDKVLDLGCGTGAIASACSASGFRVTACDVAEKMIDAGKRCYPASGIQWCVLPPDWRLLPFDACTFDAIVASSVLEYVPDVNSVLMECQRILKPDGILIATVPDPRAMIRKLEKLVRPVAALLNRLPVLNRIPKFRSYASYLKCSRNRMSLNEWLGIGAHACFMAANQTERSAFKAPLALIVFRKIAKKAGQ
jgi:ubiquinone/menaquinone biosynthesis C-methylase UbiE